MAKRMYEQCWLRCFTALNIAFCQPDNNSRGIKLLIKSIDKTSIKLQNRIKCNGIMGKTDLLWEREIDRAD